MTNHPPSRIGKVMMILAGGWDYVLWLCAMVLPGVESAAANPNSELPSLHARWSMPFGGCVLLGLIGKAHYH